jgi:hypothetical protein
MRDVAGGATPTSALPTYTVAFSRGQCLTGSLRLPHASTDRFASWTAGAKGPANHVTGLRTSAPVSAKSKSPWRGLSCPSLRCRLSHTIESLVTAAALR